MKKITCIICFILLVFIQYGCSKKKIPAPVEKAAETPKILVCSSDMIMINKKFCIDINEYPEADFEKSKELCKKQGKYLCKDEEWSISCVNSKELKNMKNDWEWVDNKDNDGNYFIIGDGSCSSHNFSVPSGSFGYRCCKSSEEQ